MPKTIDASWFKIEGEDRTEEQFYSFIKSQIDDHPVVKTQHGKWMELMEWEEGNQFSEWNSTARRVAPVQIPRKRMVVINFMKPLVETIDGKINFTSSVIGVPNSGERIDIEGSDVATKLLAFNSQVSFADKVMDDMKYDLLRTGNGCVRWFWNPAKKAKSAREDGGKIVGVKEETGDVDCYSPNIFNCRPDPTARSPKEMRWHVEIKEITRDVALSTYNEEIDPEWLKKSAQPSLNSKYSGMNIDQNEVDKEAITFILSEYIERSSVDYPKGRYIVFLDSHCVHADRNPNPGSKLGYFYYYYKKSKKSFWGHGPLYYVQDVQRETNRMVSIQCEHAESWKPKMAVPIGGLTRANSMTLDDFEIVEVNYAGGEPRPINMPELSPQVGALRDFLLGAKDMISDVHEVSYARLPQYASRAPNSLYESMLEQESIKLDPMIKRINQTIIEAASFRLELMDQHYKTRRMVKIMGPNKSSAIKYFSKVELNSNFDVQLEIGISMNQSTTMKNNLVMSLWDKKLFEGPRDKIKILKILNLGTAEEQLMSDLSDSNRAQRENQMFLDGTWKLVKGKSRGVWVYMHDDHTAHLESHTDLVKSTEAEAWDDETMAGMTKHIDEHFEFFLQLKQQTEAAAAPATPGTPDIAAEVAQEEAERGNTPGAEAGMGLPTG